MKTNLEHYAKNILDYFYESSCNIARCDKCPIHEICNSFVTKTKNMSKEFVEWCKEEYKELKKEEQKYKLTLFEKLILECAVNHGHEWIARDSTGYLYIYSTKPKKDEGEWGVEQWRNYLDMPLFDDKFQFIKWEDEEPYHIPTLLKECEVIK